MTELFVTVHNSAEAADALTAGAQGIWLRNLPDGEAEPGVLAAIVADIGRGRLWLSTERMADAGEGRKADASVVDVGPGAATSHDLIRSLADSQGPGAIARLPVVTEPDWAILRALREAGFAGALLDTADEQRLLSVLPISALAAFVETCRSVGLTSGLAGGLEPPDVPRFLALAPDVIAFSGHWAGQPANPFEPEALATMRRLVRRNEVDFSRAASDGATDRVFVRDHVVDMRVGAYGFEEKAAQKVRFSVEADVFRPSRMPSAMEDVFSYDVITDGIRVLAARAHTALVETLAEDLAALVLTDPRVEGVTVRVEKLELGPAAVGVEIRRTRTDRLG
ncbi:dihydroneopterin aldolase [Consotaella aegiceratis]|uniref:dihydroneopterin aldolase n=1 Tax=Consotaella aegiceratis TaxID=3097961 RepID=UPI002F41AF1F